MSYDVGDVMATTVDGEVFLIDRANQESFRLGGTGARFWELLAAGRDTDAVVDEVVDRTGAPRDRVAADLADFVAELVELGALVAVDEGE